LENYGKRVQYALPKTSKLINDFQETWYGHYAITGHSTILRTL